MAEGNLKGQLESLLQLQTLDSQVYKLNEEKKNQPAEVEALKKSFDEKKKFLESLEKFYVDAQKEKKDFELEFGTKEESVKKLQGQLYQLKTNKEYNTMLQQINDAKADSSTIEDKILESMDKIEKAKSAVDEEKKKLLDVENVFNEQKKKIEEKSKEIDLKVTQLDAQRKQILPNIDVKILAQYEIILHSRDGLAIVAVKSDICTGCNLQVSPQVVNLIQMYDRIITCQVCNRMLYIANE